MQQTNKLHTPRNLKCSNILCFLPSNFLGLCSFSLAKHIWSSQISNWSWTWSRQFWSSSINTAKFASGQRKRRAHQKVSCDTLQIELFIHSFIHVCLVMQVCLSYCYANVGNLFIYLFISLSLGSFHICTGNKRNICDERWTIRRIRRSQLLRIQVFVKGQRVRSSLIILSIQWKPMQSTHKRWSPWSVFYRYVYSVCMRPELNVHV